MSSDQEEIRRFEYLPILEPNQIRLIQLSSDPVRDRLLCRFTHVPLDNLPNAYKAISYYWGDPSPTDKIWTGGNCYLELNSSAAAILKYIAAQKSDTYFWIDALCINQQDVEDKNKQVPLMGRIYSAAIRVIAWLGPPSDDSDLAINFVDHLYKSITALFQRKVPITMDSLTQSTDCGFPSPRWTALARFLQRPWFQRVWIIQEVVLATDVLMICGCIGLKWKGLANVVSIISGKGLDRLLAVESEGDERRQPEGVMSTLAVYSMKVLRDNHNPLELHDSLLSCYNFKATDPRDNIWALLGTTTDAKRPTEDANHGTPPQRVFIITSIKLLANGSSLNILHAAGIGTPRTFSDLPSWVPDWASIPERTILGGISKSMLYTASGSTRPSVRIDQKANMVTLTGIIFDIIKSVLRQKPLEPIHESRELQKKRCRRAQAWLLEALNFIRYSKQYANDAVRNEVLWATLTANISFTNGYCTPAGPAEFENFKAWKSMVFQLASLEDWDQVHIPVELMRKVQACVHTMSQVGKRRVYISEQGFLGLGPEGLEEGDLIATFHGAATPFIIRGRESLEGLIDKYALVGECYMHTLMNGESLGMGKEQQIVLV